MGQTNGFAAGSWIVRQAPRRRFYVERGALCRGHGAPRILPVAGELLEHRRLLRKPTIRLLILQFWWGIGEDGGRTLMEEGGAWRPRIDASRCSDRNDLIDQRMDIAEMVQADARRVKVSP